MRTLIIVSHPDIEDSNSQQFLKEALVRTESVTYHHLESRYPDGRIDVAYEQDLVKDYDRIIFQFPFYWYAAPPLMKKWQDEVLQEDVAYGRGGNLLRGKELGLVLTIGVAEKEYQVGGSEHFTISQLTAPYQALAKKVGMTFLRPLAIHQFYYMNDQEQKALLVAYLQYLTLENVSSLHARVHWFIDQLENFKDNSTLSDHADLLDLVIDALEDNQLELDEMQMHLGK